MSVLTKGPLICIHLSTTTRFLGISIGYELEMTSISVLTWYSIFQWYRSKLWSVRWSLWWERSPLSALKLHRFFLTFISHFFPSANFFFRLFPDLFPACWYLSKLFSCVLSFFLWKCYWNDAASCEFTKDNYWKTTFLCDLLVSCLYFILCIYFQRFSFQAPANMSTVVAS